MTSSSSSQPLKITIIGGSLGGLFTAIVLKRRGHNITILERTPSALLQHQGAGIVAGGPVQSFMAQFDRTQTPIAVSSHTRQYLNRSGAVIESEERRQEMTSWDLLYNVLRQNFDGGGQEDYCGVARTDDADGSAEYLYGCKVLHVQGLGNGVKVTYTDIDGMERSRIADLVVAADGPSSTVRGLLLPDVKREYVGYVAWRGTVAENEIEEDILCIFKEKFTFFHTDGIQILAYLIPGKNGILEPGKLLLNWVWYTNYAPDSPAYKELMTDSSNTAHHFTLPAGAMRSSIWDMQKTYAASILPPPFAALVAKTRLPFVQAITDVLSPENVFMAGRLLLVGDAVAGFRPHTAASTSQAALHALKLWEEFGKDRPDLAGWGMGVREWGRDMQRSGVKMGERSQFGEHPLNG